MRPIIIIIVFEVSLAGVQSQLQLEVCQKENTYRLFVGENLNID